MSAMVSKEELKIVSAKLNGYLGSWYYPSARRGELFGNQP